MRIVFSYQGKEEVRNFDRPEILIGRMSPLSAPDVDLSADSTVSRKHSRLFFDGNEYWIEDLKSTNGTWVNGDSIQKARINPGWIIRIGETILRIEAAPKNTSTGAPALPKPVAAPAPPLSKPVVPSAPKPAAAPSPATPSVAPIAHVVPPATPVPIAPPLPAAASVAERFLAKFSPTKWESLQRKVQDGSLKPGGQRSEVTIVIAELRGFSTAAPAMELGEMTSMLSEYCSVLLGEVFKQDGTLDKFTGDTLVAVFGSPESDEHQHEHAIRAAMGMQAGIKKLNARRVPLGQPAFKIAVGMQCGEMAHGFVGVGDRFEFMAMGPAAQRALLYCKCANTDEIVIGTEAWQKVFKLIEAERENLPTKEEGELHVYRVKGWKV